MDTSQKEWFRTQLLQQREQIAATWQDEDPAENQDLRDPEELATVITRSEVEDQLAQDELNLLQKIDFALRRIDEGTYEACTGCGKAIPFERLQAKPSASLCVSCQEEKDESGR